MADKFRLDPVAMREMVARMRFENNEFTDAVRKLNDTMTRYDGCWGQDKTGKKFAEGYVKNANDVQKGLVDVYKGVDDLSDGVIETVDEFRGLDELNANEFDHQLGEDLRQQKKESSRSKD
ncbi:WXG100 family type VII secretion target [Amycolatopsis japonica]|uniref:WXG100 family type VII secretion target n=1 Tax=Amycolatopsis japonica TaxID=208439 RepID=UPI00366BB2AE